MAYADGTTNRTPGYYFDVTLQFPELPPDINTFRNRRVGPCRGRIEALRRALSDHNGAINLGHWGRRHQQFSLINVIIEKVQTFE